MNVAILGLGVVGTGVYDILTEKTLGINVSYVLELDQEKRKGKEHLVASSFEAILEDKELNTIIELIGGKTIAYKFIKEALLHKKNVVTANKAVISEYFEELTTLAKENNVSLLYEASVGGGINILNPLYTISELDTITSIKGIINGSTNFVLSKIFKENTSLAEALKQANELGFIETGSTDDLEGFDLLRKINILSMISYKQFITEESILRTPLSSLTNEMVNYVSKLDYIIKYIASSYLENNEIMIHLEPVLLTKDDLYSQIEYEENIITINGTYHQNQNFTGKGAGRYPTAGAVVSDLMQIKNDTVQSISYPNNYKINNNLKKYRFLIEKCESFFVTEYITFEELDAIDKTSFVRLGGEQFEKL